MASLQWALSWLVVFAVGLAPMLVYRVAGLIGRAFRSKLLTGIEQRAGNTARAIRGDLRKIRLKSHSKYAA